MQQHWQRVCFISYKIKFQKIFYLSRYIYSSLNWYIQQKYNFQKKKILNHPISVQYFPMRSYGVFIIVVLVRFTRKCLLTIARRIWIGSRISTRILFAIWNALFAFHFPLNYVMKMVGKRCNSCDVPDVKCDYVKEYGKLSVIETRFFPHHIFSHHIYREQNWKTKTDVLQWSNI